MNKGKTLVFKNSLNETIEIQTPRKEGLFPFTGENNLTEKDFEKADELMKDDQKIINLKMLRKGINYKPNRKIKVGTRTHYKTAKEFKIKGKFFDEGAKISDRKEYFKEKKRQLDELDECNKPTKEYNEEVDEAIEKFKKN